MKCPACSTELRMTERQSVEIDYCPSCRGIWLDRGELDKLLERSRRDQGYREDDDDDDDSDDDIGGRRSGRGGLSQPDAPPPANAHQYPSYSNHLPKRRESFWSELFDFG